MSYYETYEFFAIDRRLTHAEMRALSNAPTSHFASRGT